jgi:hypothetical protein
MNDSENIEHLSKQIHSDMQGSESGNATDLAYAARLQTTREHLLKHATDEYGAAMSVVRAAHGGKGIGRSKFYSMRKEIKTELLKAGKGKLVTRGKYAGQPLSMAPEAVARRVRYQASKDAKAMKKTPKKPAPAPSVTGESVEEVERTLKGLTKVLVKLGYVELNWDPNGWHYDRNAQLKGKI